MVGSLTGAVSSQRVTEEYEGTLGTVGHRANSAMAKACLTARPTSRAGTKVGHSDPVVLYGRPIDRPVQATTARHLDADQIRHREAFFPDVRLERPLGGRLRIQGGEFPRFILLHLFVVLLMVHNMAVHPTFLYHNQLLS